MAAPDPKLLPPLRTLGYSTRWLEQGLLEPADLLAQMQTFQSGNDADTAHFRHASFLKVLARGKLSDVVVEQYVKAALEDPDITTSRSALGRLIEHRELGAAQLARLRKDTKLSHMAALFTRVELLGHLRSGNRSKAVLERCIAEGDGTVQRELLEDCNPPREVIEALVDRGVNDKVKKIAARLLKSKPRK